MILLDKNSFSHTLEKTKKSRAFTLRKGSIKESMPEKLPPYDRRVPSRFEKYFSYGVVLIVSLLGVMVILGLFRINPGYKLPLGVIMIGYGIVRLAMLKSHYRNLNVEDENVNKLTKEDEKNLRNF